MQHGSPRTPPLITKIWKDTTNGSALMWPRLHLLKELLAEDGAIFISIDDNEQHHLRMLMDEIFGEDNFIESFIWRSRLGRGATAKNTATLHEYIIAYAKNTALVKFKEDRRIRETESKERLRQWGQGDRREDRPTMYYPIHSDEFGEVYPIKPDGTDGRWRVAQPAMEVLIENGLVAFEEQPDGRIEAYRVILAGTEPIQHIHLCSILKLSKQLLMEALS